MIKYFTRICFTILSLLSFAILHAQVNGSLPNGTIKLQGIIGHPSISVSGQNSPALKVVDVPAEQVKKECFFFGGDSLNGFDFEAASKESKKHGIKQYNEFKSFMFQTQSKYVKAKYNIPLLPIEIAMAGKTVKLPYVLSGPCNNLDLETGDFTGWVAGSGYNTNSNGALTLNATAYYGVNNNIYACDDLEIISAAYGNDPMGNFSGKDPTGGNYSARVGGYDWNTYGYGGCYPNAYYTAGYYSNGELVQQTFVVTAANALLSYDYAVVLNDGSHLNGEQPYFHAVVTNSSGTVLSSCTEYYVQAPAGGPPVGFSLSGSVGPDGLSAVYYHNWQSNSINLTPYIGQTVIATFTAAGCIYGAHFGYGYIDATCGPAQILTSNGSPCAGTTAVLTAPAVAGGTYSWSGPGIIGPTNGQSVTVNVGGTYVVTVTPSQGVGCAYTLSIVQNFSPLPSASISSQTNISCNGGNNGSATVTASGGTPGYNYSWSPSGGNAATANNLTPGTYNVTVTDSHGCTTTTAVTITQPTALTTTPSQTNLNCNGVCIGSATVVPGGGTPAYAYAWTPSGGNASSASSLCAGNYTVTVTDNKGCTKTQAYTITQPTALATAPSQINILCNGTCNGSATVIPSGGTPAYAYVWTPSGGNASSASSLCAGNYTVTVSDNKGCTKTQAYTITQPASAVNVSTSFTNSSCSASNGTATGNPSGGTPGYTYSWSPGGQNTQTATGLAGGTYTVLVTDANGCTANATVNVINTSAPTISSTSSNPAGCSVSNGTATANPSGGTPNYTYLWSPGGQNTQTATGLAGGTYTIVITDANGCSVNTTVNVGSTSAPTISSTSATLAGCSLNNGTATTNPSGGTPNYTYLWSPGGQNTQTATGLAGGTYTVLVTDASGCTVNTTVSVGSTSAPSTTASSTQATCATANGTATANPSGGTPNYTYSWSPSGQNTQIATGLSPGAYSVLVTDASGCTASATITISSANGPTVTTTVANNVSCNGGNNGSATANPTGGNPGYTFNWSPGGQSTQTATGLSAGTYTVITTDASGCSFINTTSITQPTVLASAITSSNISCNGGNNGSAIANPSGGTPNYTYLWSPSGGNAQTANNLTAGNYNVTVTDANGCTSTSSVTLTQPTVLASTTSQTNIICNGGTNGSATATPSGGTPNYTYSWSPSGGNAQTANNLSAGTYVVTVTDANGCTTLSSVTLTQPSAIVAASTQVNVLCNAGSTGSATVIPSGGTPNYTYAWSPSGGNAQTANNLPAGSYQCTVTDANGCTNVTSVTINQPQALTAPTTAVNILCNGGNNGSATATPSGGTPGYSYSWSPSGGNAQTANNLVAGNYIVTVTDANGCSQQSQVTITEPLPITLTVSGNDSLCRGGNTTLSANANGGTPLYTYLWNPGPQSGSSVVVNPTSSTNYSVAITDANGCVSLTQTFNVLVLVAPTALFDTATSGTFGSSYIFSDLSTPSVTITAWNWNFGDNSSVSTQQNPVHTFPGAGTYTVTEVVFNQTGCPDTFKVVINISEGIIIPNVFTPDGDGVNDVWYIPNSGMKEFQVTIFDRWGAKVFETTADEIRWDGHSTSGHLLSDGTYYYVLKAILRSGGGEKDYSTQGYVTLLTNKQ